jgi:hypothetical protein
VQVQRDNPKQKLILFSVVANPDVVRHIILEKAFLDFQVKSFSASLSRVIKLEIFLPDGRPIYVECCSDDPTNAVMEVHSSLYLFINSMQFAD